MPLVFIVLVFDKFMCLTRQLWLVAFLRCHGWLNLYTVLLGVNLFAISISFCDPLVNLLHSAIVVFEQFFGPGSDSVPLFGYRRRSYLILSGLLGAVSWSLMAAVVDSKFSIGFCIILGSLSVAFSDVVSIY